MSIIDRYLQKRGFVKADDIKKTAGFMGLETASAVDGQPDGDKIGSYDAFIKAYQKLPWLYAGGVALAVASIKPLLKLYQQTKVKDGVEQIEVEGHELNDLIEGPNPDLSYAELMQITVVNLLLTGNAYWNLVGTQEEQPISMKNPPVEIWWIKPEQMKPCLDGSGKLTHYIFRSSSGKSKALDISEVIHFRQANPGSYSLGMGAMEPLTNTATLEFNAVAFQKGYLENDAMPPSVFIHPGDPGEAERKRFLTAWDERHKGSKKTNRMGLIWGGMKVEKLGETMKDAQYIELRKANREEMLAGIGVPPSIVGLLEYANYSNMEVQEKRFWEGTVIPLLTLICDKINLRLTRYFDDRFWFKFDFTDIKVLQEDEERSTRIAEMEIRNGLKTPNQIRQERGNQPYEGGDQYYMQMMLVPIGADADSTTSKPTKALACDCKPAALTKGEPASYWDDPERKKLLWTVFEKRVASKERAMAPEVQKFLKQQAVHIKRRMAKFDTLEGVRTADLFDVDAEMKLYVDKFINRYKIAFMDAAEAGLQATKGIAWTTPITESIKREYEPSAEQIAALEMQIAVAAKFFNETTWETIAKIIEEAKLTNSTIAEVAQRLYDKLDALSISRSRIIARTEMAKIENWGNLEGYKENEFVTHKIWHCSFVPDSREEHMQADGQTVRLDEPFIVGGEPMMFPGEGGSAGNVCNCLCRHAPKVSLEV